MDGTKVCCRATCHLAGQPQPLAAFGRLSCRPDGRRSDCLKCNRQYQRARRSPAQPDPNDFEITEEVSPLEVAQQAHQQAQQRRDLRTEHTALLDENARLRTLLGAASRVVGGGTHPPIKRAQEAKGDAVACLVASDWHVEEPVLRHQVHGLNEYNLEVAKARAEAFFRNGLKLVDICARDSKLERVWLGLLGDFFSGYIHEELQETNLLHPTEAANFVFDLLARGLDFWLRESPYSFDIDAISGNHGRMTKKPRHADVGGTSLETFMYASLARRYAGNPRIGFRLADGEMLYREYFERFRMRLIHGNQIGYQGGIGGVTIPIRKAIAQWDKGVKASLTVLGHFHSRQDGGDFIANGSLIGYNTFAQSIKASPEQPQQAFFLVHARRGGEKALTAPIWTDSQQASRSAAAETPADNGVGGGLFPEAPEAPEDLL